MQKASQFIRLHRRASSNILGVPGWWSRVKEKGTMLKEGWSFLSVGLDVKSAMEDMERRQAKGELDEEEMKNIEADLAGKVRSLWTAVGCSLTSLGAAAPRRVEGIQV